MTTRRARAALVLGLLALVPACSKYELAKVKGTVTLDGKPLPKGTLTFETPGQRPATVTVVNGEITEATTYAAGDGVPVGAHKIAVSAHEDPGAAASANPGDAKAGKDYMSGKSLVPPAYNNPETSGLTADIKKGENTLDLKLFSAGPPK